MSQSQPLAAIPAAAASIPSRVTAVRCEFTGQLTLMDREDRIRHDRFCQGIVECLKPATALETQLAHSIAEDYWRLNRVRGLEEGIFSLGHPDPTGPAAPSDSQEIAASQTRVFLARQADFKFLNQYEMRLQRSLARHQADLKQLQAERRRAAAPEPAATAAARTNATIPAAGFVF